MTEVLERCNAVRKSIPFAFWLVYDAVVLPFLVWGALALSPWFVLAIAFLVWAAFFDVCEAIVKYGGRDR